MDYIPKYFQPYEVVPREIYDSFNNQGKLGQVWWLFDPRILLTGDRIRTRYGKMVANTWWYGGTNHYRGFRPAGCKVGATWSQHRYGRALDLVPTETSVEEIRHDIITNGENFGFITCVEVGVPWLHIDCRNYRGLLIVKP